MNVFGTRSQRGQAITEFIAAMAVFLPLFFGIVYVAKFADIKHQAIQASRYAAFERALDPLGRQETDPVLEEETRARFFTDGSLNQGKIGFQDNTSGLATNGTMNPLWYALDGTPLVQTYSDPSTGVRVTIASNSMDIGDFTPINEGGQVFFDNLNRNGQVQADVEVPIANIAHLPALLSNLNVAVAARTVVAGDAWNSGGSQDVADHQTLRSDMGKNPALKGLQALLIPFAAVFSDTPAGPQFGCLRPDVVPGQTAPGANYQPGDQCY